MKIHYIYAVYPLCVIDVHYDHDKIHLSNKEASHYISMTEAQLKDLFIFADKYFKWNMIEA